MARSLLTLVGTCPMFRNEQGLRYELAIRDAAIRAEKCGWHSLLIYSDHRQIDPWLASTMLLQTGRNISPLVAIQPLYMHPFSVAKTLCNLSVLYDRAIHLNFVSGGFPRDLEAFCDNHSHDERYERVVEYATIIRKLLKEKAPCTFAGKFYQVQSLQLQLASAMPVQHQPIFTISGSSPAGLTAARKIGAVAIQYLRPAFEYGNYVFPQDVRHGARLGIIARDTAAEAWNIARTRYPADPLRTEVRKYYVKISDSVWVKELNREVKVPEGHPYWLDPYRNNYSACPFLVGSIAEVSSELASYIRLGIRTFLIESPWNDEDAENVGKAFATAEMKDALMERKA